MGREEAVVTDVRQGRWTAEIDGDFVVFIIGARAQLETRCPQGVHGPRRPPRHEPHAQVPDATPGEGTARLRDGGLSRSFSTGDRSSTSRRSPRTRTTRISRCGATIGDVSARAPASASGTRRTSFARASTRRSTATCLRTASARRQRSFPLAESVGARQRIKATRQRRVTRRPNNRRRLPRGRCPDRRGSR